MLYKFSKTYAGVVYGRGREVLSLPKRYADPDLIQFYESTGNNLAYYVTTHGLFAQALLETTVSTWWNQLDLASCIPWKGTVRFGTLGKKIFLSTKQDNDIFRGTIRTIIKDQGTNIHTCYVIPQINPVLRYLINYH